MGLILNEKSHRRGLNPSPPFSRLLELQIRLKFPPNPADISTMSFITFWNIAAPALLVAGWTTIVVLLVLLIADYIHPNN